MLLGIEGLLRRDMSLAFKERFVQVGLVFLLVVFAIVMYNDVVRLLPDSSLSFSFSPSSLAILLRVAPGERMPASSQAPGLLPASESIPRKRLEGSNRR